MEIEELFDFLVDKFKRVLKDSEIEEESVSFAPLKEGVLRAVFKGTAGLRLPWIGGLVKLRERPLTAAEVQRCAPKPGAPQAGGAW